MARVEKGGGASDFRSRSWRRQIPLSVIQITCRPKLAALPPQKNAHFRTKNALFFSKCTHFTNNGSHFVAPAAPLHRPNRDLLAPLTPLATLTPLAPLPKNISSPPCR